MKGITTPKTVSIAMMFIFAIAFQAQAGWQLYDNFDSGGEIDESKWAKDDSSAAISITREGELKFEHKVNFPRDNSWMRMIDRPKTITGIRATMRVENCTGDVRGRMGGFIGQVGEHYVWSAARIRAFKGRIATYAQLLDSSYNYKGDIFFGAFKHNWEAPMDITNQNHTIEWRFSPRGLVTKTDAFGDIAYEYDVPLSPTTEDFRALGTRSQSGDGPCTVYFDDVYVYRQTAVTAPQTLLLGD